MMEFNPSRAGFSKRKLDRLQAHLQEHYVTPGKIPGCRLLVARKGCTATSLTLGLMDIERNLPMRDDTIFRIYSMTKPITFSTPSPLLYIMPRLYCASANPCTAAF